VVVEGYVGILCLVLAELQLAPVMVPALGDEDFDAGPLCGAQQEELALELDAWVHAVRTDDCVDAGAGGI
jgi:hypothetical protein